MWWYLGVSMPYQAHWVGLCKDSVHGCTNARTLMYVLPRLCTLYAVPCALCLVPCALCCEPHPAPTS